MTQQQTVLVVDDENTVRQVVRQYLEKEGYRVIEAETGGQALQVLHTDTPDLMILDIMLPGMDGFTITRSLRDPVDASPEQLDIPIIMLTARGDEKDRLTGFELGTDDYVVKPFSPRELVMRVKSLLRRVRVPAGASPAAGGISNEAPVEVGVLVIDPGSRTVTRDGAGITLTAKEFDLIYFLARHPGQVFSRQQLLDQIWGYDFYGDDSNVTVHVHRLREKVEADPAKPVFIHTVWGVGYKFEQI